MGRPRQAPAGRRRVTATVMEDRLLSAQDAEKVLGIPAATVRSWFRRQRMTGLYDFGRDHRNHPLFRERDLLGLRDKNRARRTLR